MSGENAAVTAVAAALAGQDEDEGEQLELLDEPETEQGRAKVAHLVRRGPGRPPGSRNKRTERTVAWLMARHRDPRERLLWVTDQHPADLAALLGCRLIEALTEIRLAAQTVLPYVAEKRPIAVDLTNHQVVHLHLSTGGDAAASGGGVGLTAAIVDNVEYQELSEEANDGVGQPGVGQGTPGG